VDLDRLGAHCGRALKGEVEATRRIDVSTKKRHLKRD
jgi:hypothetical protein